MSSSLFIRADLNIPTHDNTIINDYKLRLYVDTYHTVSPDYSRIVLATHQGRPTGSISDPTTHIHAQWLTQHGIATRYITLDDLIAEQPTHGTFILPNLRTYSGEQSDNKILRNAFAQKLFKTAHSYLFDAFGVAHRSDTSVMLLPCLYPESDRLISQHTQAQLTLLQQFKQTQKMRLIILGGTKASTKLSYIPDLLKEGIHVIVCPPLSLAFQPEKAAKIDIEIPQPWINEAYKVQQEDPYLLKLLTIPHDYIITTPVQASKVDMPFVGPGALSMALILETITKADAILYNGLMGSVHHPETLLAVKNIFLAMSQSSAQPCIIAGGDSVAAALRLHIKRSKLTLNAAGGASLAYIAGQSLPAFTCLRIKT